MHTPEQQQALDWLREQSPRTWEMVMGSNPLQQRSVLTFVTALQQAQQGRTAVARARATLLDLDDIKRRLALPDRWGDGGDDLWSEDMPLLVAEVERLRGILGETERVIADLVQVVGMDYDPELHPADTLRQFDAALGERLTL